MRVDLEGTYAVPLSERGSKGLLSLAASLRAAPCAS